MTRSGHPVLYRAHLSVPYGSEGKSYETDMYTTDWDTILAWKDTFSDTEGEYSVTMAPVGDFEEVEV
jgi:hypothetical protein